MKRLAILFVVISLLSTPAWSAVAVTSTGTPNAQIPATGGNLTTLTVGAGSTMLVAGVNCAAAGTAAGTAMTWNSVSMTTAGSYQAVANLYQEVWYIASPSSGNQTLTFVSTGGLTVGCDIWAISFSGSGSTPDTFVSTGAVSTTPVIAVTSSAGDATIGCTVNVTSYVTMPTQTAIFTDSTGPLGGACSYALGATATHSWTATSTQWVASGIHIPAGSAPVAITSSRSRQGSGK